MSEKIKILIVDDSSIIRKIIVKSVLEDQFEISGVAGNGLQALELFREKMPDIVTLDITMPEMDGLSVLEQMIQIKPEVKVIVVSALTDKATGIKAIKMGAKSFVPKPFTTDDLQKTILKLAGKN
ncbi:MAG: response regulator [Calditrichaeota bacterium]|nr:response regulator [Calditrichota bacterium]